MNSSAPKLDDRLLDARVLIELGELFDAELLVADVLDEHPDDLTGLNLYAKIKHIRGELSQAVACWAQLHARSPHNELALMCLGSIMQLAKDPERGAGEFLALGQFQLARKPAAHLELEAAFHEFLARRPNEARAACERMAAKYEGKDRELYKLGILASAWIAELSQDFTGARTVLENLGNERGFETDTDRVLSLARVYEQIGSPDCLEKAVHIFQFLERSYSKMSSRSRLAAIYRKLGRAQLAEEYDKKFLEAFQQRMHRPSLHQVARVGARRYLPLASLRKIHPIAFSSDEATSVREQALVAFLRDQPAAAEELFRAGAEALDRKYLADLAVLRGDEAEGARAFLATLRTDPADMNVLNWVLAYHARTASADVQTFFRQEPACTQTLQMLDRMLRATPLRGVIWRDMAQLRTITGDTAEAARCSERATALEEARLRNIAAVGRVLAAAVYHFVGKAKGLIHQIWVDRKRVEPGRGGFMPPDEIHGNLTEEMQRSIRNTFFAVREYARSRFPQQTADILDYNYAYKVTKEDEPSGGQSAGLPTALAFLSVFLQRPVPQDIASSGMVIADAHDVLTIRAVGESEYKVKGAYHRNLRMLILPRENRVNLVGNSQVPGAVCDQIVRYAANLDEAVTLVFGEDIWVS